MEAVAATAHETGVIAAACAALGLSRASFHRRQAGASRPAAPVGAPTYSSIRRWAAKPIMSRRISASGAFSTRARRFIMRSVIGGSLVVFVFTTHLDRANRR